MFHRVYIFHVGVRSFIVSVQVSTSLFHCFPDMGFGLSHVKLALMAVDGLDGKVRVELGEMTPTSPAIMSLYLLCEGCCQYGNDVAS